MRPPISLSPLLGSYQNYKGEGSMMVKIRINGREFTLTWEEFEKALLRNDLSGGQIEVISIFTGMRPCYSLQAG